MITVTIMFALLGYCTKITIVCSPLKCGIVECVVIKKVQVGKDQEKAQSEKDSNSKNDGKKLNYQSGTYTMKIQRKPNGQLFSQ